MEDLNKAVDDLLKSMDGTLSNIGKTTVQSQLISIHAAVVKNNNINQKLLIEIMARLDDVLEIIKKSYGGELGDEYKS